MSKHPRNPIRYSGDAAILKSFSEVVKQAREEAGMTIEEAAAMKEFQKTYDYRPSARALGIVRKETRLAQEMTRRELSRISDVPLRKITLCEQGKPITIYLTDLVRMAYAMNLDLVEIDEEGGEATGEMSSQKS